MEIRKATQQEIKETSHRKYHPKYPPYLIQEEGETIAYLWTHSLDCVLEIDFFEVIYKGRGNGKHIIQELFNTLNVCCIKGRVLRSEEETAYWFWKSLGADVEDISEYGKDDEVSFYLFMEDLIYE